MRLSVIFSWLLVLITGSLHGAPQETLIIPEEPAADEKHQIGNDLTDRLQSILIPLIPETFEDDDDWGQEKRIQSGLNIRTRNGQVRTSRRWKTVNHGSWEKISASLLNPDQTFRLELTQLPETSSSILHYELQLSGQLRTLARQQQWSYGVMLWSVSAEADVEVSLTADFEVQQEFSSSTTGRSLRFQPVVRNAYFTLHSFRARRISHSKGTVPRQIGEWAEPLIQREVEKLNRDLTTKLNRTLTKYSHQFDLPVWLFGSEIRKSDQVAVPEED